MSWTIHVAASAATDSTSRTIRVGAAAATRLRGRSTSRAAAATRLDLVDDPRRSRGGDATRRRGRSTSRAAAATRLDVADDLRWSRGGDAGVEMPALERLTFDVDNADGGGLFTKRFPSEYSRKPVVAPLVDSAEQDVVIKWARPKNARWTD